MIQKTDSIIRVALQLAVIALAVMRVEAVPAASEPQVVVRDTARLSSDKVYLRDIATINGDIDFIRRARQVVIGNTPYPGKVRYFYDKQIRMRMKLYDIDVQAVRFISPKKVKVERDCRTYSSKALQNSFRGFILREMPWNKNQVQIENMHCDDSTIPNVDVTLKFITAHNEEFRGHMTADICFQDASGGCIEKSTISCNIVVYEKVVVSAAPIERNTVIGPEHLRHDTVDITHLSRSIVRNKKEISGMSSKKHIREGAVLKHDMFEPTPAVKRGDIVTIYVENRDMRIATPGKVLEDGAVGDLVAVANLSSKKHLYGYVQGKTSVEIRN